MGVTPGGTTSGPGEGAPFAHVTTDFIGVAAARLADQALISGLVIAAASAAGLSASGSPVVRPLPESVVAGLLMIDGCHILAHAFPDRELLLLDILAMAHHDPQKAVDVFARRLTPREIRSEMRPRG
ncbi:MAG TPA: S-adenosylmethionine decarboxylase [Gemmatimonadaceae bacterium]|nr:S-adenosylmethionine decarboxylase [Gemmatimonadaceae bacterium]